MPRPRLTPAGMRTLQAGLPTTDSFENAQAQLGVSYGQSPTNLLSGSTYNYSPITRNRLLLENAYRSSWLVRRAIDTPAEDMTREGIDFDTTAPPDIVDACQQFWQEWGLWQQLHSGISWGRLYGGAIVVPIIEGQDLSTRLYPVTVRQDQFKGVLILDRWMCQPALTDLVETPGWDFGLPRYYDVYGSSPTKPNARIHHSRVIRFEGDPLPYWQRQAENLWSASVLESPYDRFLAYDSTSLGAAQLVYKAHLRTMKVKGLRNIIAQGGKMMEGLTAQMNFVRYMQSIEGMALIDQDDELESSQYSFGGLSDIMLQFGQQISGSLGIPLVRLFGQSPTGLNSSGESDLSNYYDHIKSLQERVMRRGISLLVDLTIRSVTGLPPPKGTTFKFTNLWQIEENEKQQNAQLSTQTVLSVYEAGLISAQVALKELRQQSKATGVWSNITDEDIAAADQVPPAPEMPDATGSGYPADGEEGMTEEGSAPDNAGPLDEPPMATRMGQPTDPAVG
jgi:phage-related protein (TIGR01555 family)